MREAKFVAYTFAVVLCAALAGIGTGYAEKSDSIADSVGLEYCSPTPVMIGQLTTILERYDRISPIPARHKKSRQPPRCTVHEAPPPCDNACKTVEIVCENPPSNPNQPAPPAADDVLEPAPPQAGTSSLPPSSTRYQSTASSIPVNPAVGAMIAPNENFPCPGSMCVARNNNGACKLYLGNGVMDPYWSLGGTKLSCGVTVTVDEWRKIIEDIRNILVDMVDEVSNPANLEGASDEQIYNTLMAIYNSTLMSCGLMDEYYHMVDQYACKHPGPCQEFSSGEANLRCLQDHFITLKTIQKIIDLLPSQRTAILKHYCSLRLAVELAVPIEKCACDLSRNGNLSPQSCEKCISNATGTTPVSSFKSPPSNSICAGVLTAEEIEAIKNSVASNYRDPSDHTHACPAYVDEACIRKWCDISSPTLQDCLDQKAAEIRACQNGKAPTAIR